MAQAFKCDLCGRLISGQPYEVAGEFAVQPLVTPALPRRDGNNVPVIELCQACHDEAQDALRDVAERRRASANDLAHEMARLAGDNSQWSDR